MPNNLSREQKDKLEEAEKTYDERGLQAAARELLGHPLRSLSLMEIFNKAGLEAIVERLGIDQASGHVRRRLTRLLGIGLSGELTGGRWPVVVDPKQELPGGFMGTFLAIPLQGKKLDILLTQAKDKQAKDLPLEPVEDNVLEIHKDIAARLKYLDDQFETSRETIRSARKRLKKGASFQALSASQQEALEIVEERRHLYEDMDLDESESGIELSDRRRGRKMPGMKLMDMMRTGGWDGVYWEGLDDGSYSSFYFGYLTTVAIQFGKDATRDIDPRSLQNPAGFIKGAVSELSNIINFGPWTYNCSEVLKQQALQDWAAILVLNVLVQGSPWWGEAASALVGQGVLEKDVVKGDAIDSTFALRHSSLLHFVSEQGLVSAGQLALLEKYASMLGYTKKRQVVDILLGGSSSSPKRR